jgi:hypothetical protein
MDNIMKKVYGEKYYDIKNNKVPEMVRSNEPSLVDMSQITTAKEYENFARDAEKIINADTDMDIDINTDTDTNNNTDTDTDTDTDTNTDTDTDTNTDTVTERKLSGNRAKYIGKRNLKN